MISAFLNCVKIPEVRNRLLFTLGLLFIARIGANIPLPGIDPTPLLDFFDQQSTEEGSDSGSVLGLYNMFTGGALLKGAIFALGIMPYISASIILQLMTAVVPTLSRLQREGDSGRQKIAQYTRYLTVGICLIQGLLLMLALWSPASLFPQFDGKIVVIDNKAWFLFYGTLLLTCGTVVLMWLGEQITQRGLGNGISLLITVGILADMPGAITTTIQLFTSEGVGTQASLHPLAGVAMVALLLGVIGAVVALTQGQRKIPVQYAKRQVGRRVYGGQSSFLPLKVNYSGVMPIIFASAILLFLQQVATMIGSNLLTGNPDSAVGGFFEGVGEWFDPRSWPYYIIYGTLIMLFSYFWVSVMFRPIQVADDLKKYGGYVPGVRPGQPTANFLDFVMTRLTFAGAIFLTIVAVIPNILYAFADIPFRVAQFFGGTGTLIIVGVMLDTLRQIETHLLQENYQGFLKKGKIKGRSGMGRTSAQRVQSSEFKHLSKLWWFIGVMFVVGMVGAIVEKWVID